MADELTATGLTIDALEDRLEAWKAALRAAISANLDLSADQPEGQLVQIPCERIQATIELVQAIYAAWNPDDATGHSLTALALLTGTEKRRATYGTVTLTCTLAGGVTLTGGQDADSVNGDPTNIWIIDDDFTSPAGPPAIRRSSRPP